MIWLNRTDYLLLASASPRRLALLQQIGVPTQQSVPPSPPGQDEPRLAGELIKDYVCRTAHDKLLRALAHDEANLEIEARPILTADTTVSMGEQLFGKPQDDADARRMLAALSGQTHDVLTAVCLHWRGHTDQALSHSRVRFAPLTASAIDAYIQTKEPQGKAGAYAIQGMAACFVEELQGSFSGVMGLPLYETAQLLSKAGLMN